MMKFTRNLSYPHLVALILSLAGVVFFVFLAYASFSGARFIRFITGAHEEQGLHRIPGMFAAGLDELVERKAREPWERLASGTFTRSCLDASSLLEALWIADPASHSLQIMNDSQCYSLPLDDSRPWTRLLNDAMHGRTAVGVPLKPEMFVGSGTFARLDRYRVSDDADACFCACETAFGTNAPLIRGVVLRKTVLFERVVGKYLNLHCNSNRMALELLDSGGGRVFLSKGGFPFQGPFDKRTIGADAELVFPALSGVLAGYRIKAYYSSRWGEAFVPSFGNIPLAVIPFMTLLLAGGIVYFYAKTKSGEETLRLQNDWIANLAHSMRGPVHSLGVLTEAYASASGESRDKLAKLIQGELAEMDSTYRQFIRLSRMGMDRLSLVTEPVDLLDALTAVCHRLLPRYPRFDPAKLKVQAASGTCVRGDARAVSDVLETALDNALKYSLDGTPIEVTCEECDGNVHVSIADHGMGVPLRDLPRVGEPFFRSLQENADGIAGTGLGVYLAKMLCEKMGGRYDVASEGAGRGCVVTITLPGVPA